MLDLLLKLFEQQNRTHDDDDHHHHPNQYLLYKTYQNNPGFCDKPH